MEYGGWLRSSRSPGAPRRLRLQSPATLEPIGEIEVQGAEAARSAVEAARKAQPAWAASTFDDRARGMPRALRILLDRQEEFIEVVLKETGKTRSEPLYPVAVAARRIPVTSHPLQHPVAT